MHNTEFTPSSLEDLKSLKKAEQRRVLQGIENQLSHEPTVETRNRKRLRPNDISTWELRIGTFRIFYNVIDEEMVVSIEAIGFKVGNTLFIRNIERML